MSLPAAIAEAPLLFAVFFAIFAPLIWWKWRVTGSSVTKAIDDQTHGFRAVADTRQVRHETGVGSRDFLVMRPNKLGGMIWFGLLFFGGGAVFYLLVVLPAEPTSKNWLTFAVLSGFTIINMVLIEMNQARFLIHPDYLERRRVLYRSESIPLSSIAKITPMGKTYRSGLRIMSSDGRKMTIPARFSGYRALIARLAPYSAELRLLDKMAKDH